MARTTRDETKQDSLRRSTGARPSDEQLLDDICAVFAESGFRGASMSTLAERAGTTKPTLYAHFGSKEELYDACLRREADKLTQWLFAAYDRAAELPVQEQVHADMRAFFDYASTHPAGFRLLFDDHTPGNLTSVRGELLESITDRIAERFRAVITARGRATPGVSAELLAAMVVGIAAHGARHAVLIHPTDSALAGDLASALAYQGMRHLDPDLMRALDGG